MESRPFPYDFEPTFTEGELCNRDGDSEMEENSWGIVKLPGSCGPTDRRENTKLTGAGLNKTVS